MRSILACVLAAVLVLAVGCKDEQSDALPPPSGGGAASGPIAVRDAGTPPPPDPGGDEDAGGGGAGDEGDSGYHQTKPCPRSVRTQ